MYMSSFLFFISFFSPFSTLETKRDNRMQCFPFIENGDGGTFAYGDGTVYYNNRLAIPSYIREDNVYARAVFVVRNPIDRIVSHFKFAYKSLPKYLQNVNRLVGVALRSDGGMYVCLHMYIFDVM